MPSEIDSPVTAAAEPIAPTTAYGCHRNPIDRLRHGARQMVARALGAPLWACAALAALGLAAALLLALHWREP